MSLPLMVHVPVKQLMQANIPTHFMSNLLLALVPHSTYHCINLHDHDTLQVCCMSSGKVISMFKGFRCCRLLSFYQTSLECFLPAFPFLIPPMHFLDPSAQSIDPSMSSPGLFAEAGRGLAEECATLVSPEAAFCRLWG